jgi:hypothetical protein
LLCPPLVKAGMVGFGVHGVFVKIIAGPPEGYG